MESTGEINNIMSKKRERFTFGHREKIEIFNLTSMA